MQTLTSIAKQIFIIAYVLIVTPALYNLGSREIGCPIYEMRTGKECIDILE